MSSKGKMFISAEEPALNHISPNVWYIGSGQGMWVEQGSSWEGSASSYGGGDLATYVVVAVPRFISLIYGWLTAIAQQVYCQEMGDRKPFSTYVQPKTTVISLGAPSITFPPRMREIERQGEVRRWVSSWALCWWPSCLSHSLMVNGRALFLHY